MTVKLVGSTSGSVSLQAPASTTGGAHRVLTLPDADGTVAVGSTGKILQVKQTVKLDTFTTTSTSDVDVTGLSVAITPSSSSNKILVTVSIALGQQSANFTYAILKRGSTQIGEADGANNRLRPTLMQYDGNEGVVRTATFNFLDTPNTTSATTYKIAIRCATSGTSYVNRSHRDTDGVNNDPRVSSTITAMEVAA